jgi:hypothetical protein
MMDDGGEMKEANVKIFADQPMIMRFLLPQSFLYKKLFI